MREADLRRAKLMHAILKGTDLREANLDGADLFEANLQKTDLSNANLMNSSLVKANLIDANIYKCKVYGCSTWDIKRSDNTMMRDLIISTDDQPLMTVDDIEVAQFIYMILNNKKIKNVIDTMRTKAVLILGSFEDKSKAVLEIIKDVIRSHNYLPLLFDFKLSDKQELMETVSTLALLSNFVIIDLSIPAGQLHELAKLVPNTYIPFVTIAREGTKVTAMQDEFRHHYWYRNEYFKYSQEKATEDIPILFDTDIIPWVEQTNSKLRNV